MPDINWGIIAPILAVQLILLLIALIDCIRSEQTKGPKWVWIFVMIFGGILGPVVYFIFGRSNR